ncbi:TPA: hypothetical protein P2I01_003630 [Aeromonas salmonicida]|nr:hypothetical protein [Aeromonas salmonicida]
MFGFDIGGALSSALDYADQAFSTVLGGVGEAGQWMQSNPGAATLLGSALVAGGSYMENRDALNQQRQMRDEEWDRRDQYAMPVTDGMDFAVTPGELGPMEEGPLTNGLLAGIKNKKG